MWPCFEYFKRACSALVGVSQPRPDSEQLPSYTDLFGDLDSFKNIVKPPSYEKTSEICHDIKSCNEAGDKQPGNIVETAPNRETEVHMRSWKLANDPHLEQLAAKCRGCHARARIARTYLEHTGVSCRRYLRTVGQGHQIDLSAAISLSLRQVRKVNSDAAQLFLFFSYFHHADLAYSLLAAADVLQSTWINRVTASAQVYDEAMILLREYGLVECTEDLYRLHPLIHQEISQSLNPGPLFSTFTIALRCIAFSYNSLTIMEKHNRQRRFMLHAEHLMNPKFERMMHFAMQDPNCIEALISLARTYQRWNQPEKASSISEPIVKARQQNEKPALSITATAMSNLAKTLAKQGQKEQAVELYKQALEVLDATPLDSSPIPRWKTLRRLGCLYGTLCRLDESEIVLKKLLNELLMRSYGEHRDVGLIVRVYADNGLLRQLQGHFDQAVTLLQTALNDHEHVLDLDDRNILLVYIRMGDTYARMGKNSLTDRAYRRALQGYTRQYGAQDKKTVSVAECLKRREELATIRDNSEVEYEPVTPPERPCRYGVHASRDGLNTRVEPTMAVSASPMRRRSCDDSETCPEAKRSDWCGYQSKSAVSDNITPDSTTCPEPRDDQ